MSKNTDEIRRKADQIHQNYTARFAGMPRISREAGILDAMVKGLDELIPNAGDATLRADLQTTRELYVKEAASVRAAQAAGPEAFEAHNLSTWAQLTFSRYGRHFAGKSRTTRDLGLLEEMIADLEKVAGQMDALASLFSNEELTTTRSSLDTNLELYRSELSTIAEARGAESLERQADLLATIANDQFAIYKEHFAGKSRLSRRPALLNRVVTSLAGIQERMKALQSQGLRSEMNDKNVEVISERMKAYRAEVEAIRTQKQQTTFEQLVSALGGTANETFEVYREHFAGKDRKTRDLSILDRLLDELLSIAKQMDALDRVRADASNERNLSIVVDHMRLYERERSNIVEAQQADQTPSA